MTRYDMADAMRNVIDEQREEITALKADVAKLFALLKHESEQTEKLRELAQDMFDGMCDHDRCGICPHWQEGYNGCEYHARMHELGVTDG